MSWHHNECSNGYTAVGQKYFYALISINISINTSDAAIVTERAQMLQFTEIWLLHKRRAHSWCK